jgi:transposase
VEVCVLCPVGQSDPPVRERFGTLKRDLIRLRMWLVSLKVTQVAMESTGTYWMPVWRELEGHIVRRVLVNPLQVKALAGRKSDKRDSKRIAEFLQDDRLDASFVPPREIRQLRDLVRRRVTLVQQRNRVSNRIEKLLQSHGVKLSSVASDLLGKTGRRILQAMAEGQTDPERLSWKAVGSLREKEEQLRQALRSDLDEAGRWLLAELLSDLQHCEESLERLDRKITEAMAPYADAIGRLMTIPGVDRLTAWSLIAELGVDMEVFPTDRHCTSWAGLCPGTNQSADRQHSTRTRRGNRYLRRALTQSAWAVSHCKRGYLRSAFYRTAQRAGKKKAAVATARRLLVISYHILKEGTSFIELGEDYFDLLHRDQTARRLTRRLENIGYKVTLTPIDPAGPEAHDQPATPSRKRGRPCKCAERGIDCKHKP